MYFKRMELDKMNVPKVRALSELVVRPTLIMHRRRTQLQMRRFKIWWTSLTMMTRRLIASLAWNRLFHERSLILLITWRDHHQESMLHRLHNLEPLSNRKPTKNLTDKVGDLLLHYNKRASLLIKKTRATVELQASRLIHCKSLVSHLVPGKGSHNHPQLKSKNIRRFYTTPWQLTTTTWMRSFHYKRRNQLLLSPLARPTVAAKTIVLKHKTAFDSCSKLLRTESLR